MATRIKSAGSSWLHMLVTPHSLLDVVSFAPGLLELCGAGWLGVGLQGVRLDLRWFRIFRALRLLRLCLLTGNLPLMKLSRSALLSGAVNVRLMQLVASVLALLFTSASLVQAVERLPWHDALYFVTTTLTTVGYGDVVVKTTAGRLIVLVFMAVGVVLIPVRTSQLWAQLASRRITAGTLTPGRPVVLLSSRLTEVRGFADLTEEFFHQVSADFCEVNMTFSGSAPTTATATMHRFVPHNVHLMVLGNKPSYEFVAFQELHEQRISLVEGSVLSAADLVRCRAEAAAAVLVLGDRFAHDAAAEDLDVLFRVWAIKSYTKCVPLTVQVLRASSLAKVSPFLDAHQDVLMSVEQMRHRLLALSALCPGASTLLGNLLHTAQPGGRGGGGGRGEELRDSVFRPRGSPPPKLAGRTWFADRRLAPADQLLVIAHSEKHALEVKAPTVAAAAAAATQQAEAEEEAVAAATAAAAAAATAAAAAQAREAADAFGGGGGDGGGGDFSDTDTQQQQQQFMQLQQQAAAATATAAAVPPSSADVTCTGSGGGGGSGSGGAARVKRYFPSLASWDEDVPDYYPDKEGTFFSGQYGDASRDGGDSVRRQRGGCEGGFWNGGDGDGPEAAEKDAGRIGHGGEWVLGGRGDRVEPGLRRRTPEPGGSSSGDVMYGITEVDAWKQEDVTPESEDGCSEGGGAAGATAAVEPRVSLLQFAGTRYYPATAATASIDGGRINSSRSSVGSSSESGRNAVGCQDSGAALPYLSSVSSSSSSSKDDGDGSRSGGEGGGGANAPSITGSGSLAVFTSPYLDKRVVPTEADIGAVHTAAAPAPTPSGPGVRTPYSGSSGSLSFSSRITSGGGGSIGARVGISSSSSVGGCSTRKGKNSGTPSGGSSTHQTGYRASAFQTVRHQPPPNPAGRPYTLADAPWRQPPPVTSCPAGRRGHLILAGAIDSFVEFARVLHSCAGMRDPVTGISSLEVVVLHPNPPEAAVLALGAMGPTRVVRGSPADPRALQQAGAAQARCLVYLGPSERPAGHRSSATPSSSADYSPYSPSASSDTATTSSSADYGSTSRAGVQADAEALLTCYGVGEESVPLVSEESADECVLTAADWGAGLTPLHSATAAPAGAPAAGDSHADNAGGGGGRPYMSSAVRGHSVVELSFTSSVRFLQPGLLLQGTSVWDESCSVGGTAAVPRRSWRQRREAEVAAAAYGLVQWQTNIYYGAGRVVVPALVDTFTIQAFAKRNLLLDVMSELCGDDGRPQGTPLRLLPVPRELAGRPYRELFEAVVARGSVPLGLYRSKPENPAWRLHYVSTNPAWEDVVSRDDQVFVLRPAEGPKAGYGDSQDDNEEVATDPEIEVLVQATYPASDDEAFSDSDYETDVERDTDESSVDEDFDDDEEDAKEEQKGWAAAAAKALGFR
ncbi:hypothetical protein VOLCADRAFT_106827 [Volvox carteri f. nagariensis]|uniref:Potassium channel domain-containing protein n=1 Tax=Volvox carteri f. nagariensis TaxID=3068 RepID=D8UA07_VOLCA|nr:uncharacterized protein VOLCADRAFT_106827 [Volvox carteri f. nagariensis]EFJ43388.1 hypothetical protein VOLCADRAFT_106827 [Volvox carteri f. nagariensis]|eukprot:XP_002955535.1 hypothetical protein VOLCADRAFT_106827 [Volvox carteri f. nagariensis]